MGATKRMNNNLKIIRLEKPILIQNSRGSVYQTHYYINKGKPYDRKGKR